MDITGTANSDSVAERFGVLINLQILERFEKAAIEFAYPTETHILEASPKGLGFLTQSAARDEETNERTAASASVANSATKDGSQDCS